MSKVSNHQPHPRVSYHQTMATAIENTKGPQHLIEWHKEQADYWKTQRYVQWGEDDDE